MNKGPGKDALWNMFRSKTLLALAVIALLSFVVSARLLLGPDGAPNGSGELETLELCGGVRAVGARSPSDYETLAEAEKAFGFDLPDVHAPGWSFVGADTHDYPIDRESPGPPPNGGEFIGGNVRYECVDRTQMSLQIFPAGGPQMAWIETGHITNRTLVPAIHPTAEVLEYDDGLIRVLWKEDGRVYSPYALPRGGFTKADILEVIGSME